MTGAYDGYGYGTSPGGKITNELVARTRQLKLDWSAHKAWIEGLCNPTGGFDATKLRGADFLVVTGDEQAFHDDVTACADGISSAVTTLEGNLSKLGRGS